jgi:hypothetical protein
MTWKADFMQVNVARDNNDRLQRLPCNAHNEKNKSGPRVRYAGYSVEIIPVRDSGTYALAVRCDEPGYPDENRRTRESFDCSF